jgi:hypothetical protein
MDNYLEALASGYSGGYALDKSLSLYGPNSDYISWYKIGDFSMSWDEIKSRGYYWATTVKFSGEYHEKGTNDYIFDNCYVISFKIYLDNSASAANSGGMNSSINGTPEWMQTTGKVVAASGPTNQVKQQLFNLASKSGTGTPANQLKYIKGVRGLGAAGSVFGMGVSGYNIYNDYQQGGIDAVNGWDVADFGVGAASLGAGIFLASNPVGWVIAGGATIYFTGRLIYDLATDE